MGYNTKMFDREAYYGGMTLHELEQLRDSSIQFQEKYPQFKQGWHNEHLEYLRMKIAERIGNKK